MPSSRAIRASRARRDADPRGERRAARRSPSCRRRRCRRATTAGPNLARLGALKATSTWGARAAGESTSCLGDAHVGVRGAAARLGAVARDVRGVEPFVDRGAGEEHRRRLRAVAAGARELERRRRCRTSCAGTPGRSAAAPRSRRPIARQRRLAGRRSAAASVGPAARRVTSFFTPSGKTGTICSLHPALGLLAASGRGAVGHSASTSTNAKPRFSTWSWSAFRIALLRLHALLGVVERDALDVDRAVELRDQLRHPQRLAHRAGRARRASSPCVWPISVVGRHLAAGHAVDGVVDEDDGDRHAELRGLEDLGEADRREVAVALVADDDRIRGWRACGRAPPPARGRARPGCCRRRGSSRGTRAADRRDRDRAVLDARARRWPRPGTCGRGRGRSRGSSGCCWPFRPSPWAWRSKRRRRRSCGSSSAAQRRPDRASTISRSLTAARRRSAARDSMGGVRDPGVAQRQPQLVLELPVARLDHDEPAQPSQERRQEARSGTATASCGRKRPARTPRARSARTAPFAIRAGVLQATSRTSASSHRNSSARCSRSRDPRRTSRSGCRLCASRSASARWIEEIRLRAVGGVAADRPGRQARASPCVARQPHLARHLAEVAVGRARPPDCGTRRPARRRACVRSSISWGVAGASTIAWVLPWPSPRQASLMSDCSGAMLPRPGPAAHDVDEDAGQLGADHVRDPLQHQAEAGRGGEGHATAGRRRRSRTSC